MNHRVNAKVHRLPQCLECGAPALEPCVTERGALREPHKVRSMVAAGEIRIVPRKPKAPNVGALRKGLLRAVDNAVDDVRRNWGVSNKRSKR